MKIQNWHIGTDKKTIRDEDGCHIATAEPTDSVERDEAHARLIAKAPELLATLKNVLALHEADLGDTTVDRIENLISSLS